MGGGVEGRAMFPEGPFRDISQVGSQPDAVRGRGSQSGGSTAFPFTVADAGGDVFVTGISDEVKEGRGGELSRDLVATSSRANRGCLCASGGVR